MVPYSVQEPGDNTYIRLYMSSASSSTINLVVALQMYFSQKKNAPMRELQLHVHDAQVTIIKLTILHS